MTSSPDPRVVLVIDDDPDGAESLADALGVCGLAVHVARTGGDGIRAALAVRPHAILCDIGLPDMDGHEVARTLRRHDSLRSIRLIAVSGFARQEDRAKARAAGFDAHVAKPPDLDRLLALLGVDG